MNNNTETIGGISFNDVIAFQTKIMMGVQFGRVMKAKQNRDSKELIIACLRMGWNDAFRHVSRNTQKAKSLIDNYRKESKETYDDYICEHILSSETVLYVFNAFALAKTGKARIFAVDENFEQLKEVFKDIKMIEGDKKLCFGHFQKMFNIALKLYVCLYFCRENLGIDGLFNNDIIANISNADCPIDSIILNRLDEKSSDKTVKYSDFKWSQFGTEAHSSVEYENVQRAISNFTNGNSNLLFDFTEWNI